MFCVWGNKIEIISFLTTGRSKFVYIDCSSFHSYSINVLCLWQYGRNHIVFDNRQIKVRMYRLFLISFLFYLMFCAWGNKIEIISFLTIGRSKFVYIDCSSFHSYSINVLCLWQYGRNHIVFDNRQIKVRMY